MFLISFFKGMWKYKQLIFGALFVLFIGLFLNQCNQTKEAKAKTEMTQKIADQNLKALSDNTVQLVMTKKQLSETDSNLSYALNKIDSIGDIKTKEITVTRPIYVGKDVFVPTTLSFDTSKHAYGLKFTSTDMVRTINGTSWFQLKENEHNYTVVPDSTKINDFKLNFTLVISQYDDNVTKYTRTKILPFNVKDDGSLGNQIPDSLLKINFRNAEVLDKPYTLPASQQEQAKKGRLMSGWGVTLNPAAVGLYPASGGVKWGWTPNIGFGYYITLRQK